MEQLVNEGKDLDEIILEMIEERVDATQRKQAQGVSASGRVMVFAYVQCILDRTSTFVPMTLF